MKRIIAVLLSACMLLGNVAAARAEDFSDSLVLSLGYTDEGEITDSCDNFTAQYSASFPSNQTKYPNAFEVKTIDSEGGHTKTIHSEYGGIKLMGDKADEIAGLEAATFEFWMKFDAAEISSSYNSIWYIAEEGNSKYSQEWQFQTQSDKSINLRARMVYNQKSETNDNKRWLDPCPNISGINGKWAHFVATKEKLKNGNWTITVYLNGSIVKTITQKPLSEDSDENTYIMMLDRIQSIDLGTANIYNKALTAEDVKELYSETKDNYIPLPTDMTLKEITAPGGNSDSPAELNMYEESVSLTFSNYVDDSSLSEITLTDEAGNPVESTIEVSSRDAKVVVMSFGVLEADKVYKLTIGSDLSSKNGYTHNEEIVYYYIARDRREALRFVSCEPENGIIPLRNGQIKLQFSELVDENTISGAVSFKNLSGTEVGGCSIYIDPEDKKSIIIDYPVVQADKKYVITASESLKSKVGMSLNEALRIEVTGENPYAICDYDFSKYFSENDIGKAIEKDSIPYIEFSSDTTAQKVDALESGDKYISIIPRLPSNEYQIVAKFPEAVANGDAAVVEAKIRRRGKTSYAADIARINGDAATNGPVFNEKSIGGVTLDVDDDGFSNVKYMIRQGSDGYYYTEIFYYAGGSEIKYTKTYSARSISSVSSILIAHLYTTSDPAGNGYGDSLDLKSLKMYIAKEIMAESSSLENYNTASGESIFVNLTAPAKSLTVNTDTVYLREADSKVRIPWELVSYDGDLLQAEFKLVDTYLSYGKDYEVVCEGVEGVDGTKSKTAFAKSFKTAPFRISAGSDSALRYKNGELSFKASLVRSDSEKLTAVMILYDDAGRIQNVESADAVWNGRNGSVSVSLTNTDVVNGYYARAYLIDMTDTAFAPITEKPVELIIK